MSLRIIVEIIALALLLAGSTEAATFTVNASGGADYKRVQDAINNASAGDTILVYSGTYYEDVNVSKLLVLRGIDNGGGKPVVDANRNGSAITLSAGNSMLDGFTAVNASYFEAGIRVNSNNNILMNNTAMNNTRYGFLLSSINTTLSSNTASNNGFAGISIEFSSNTTLNGNTASNNGFVDISIEFSSNSRLINNTMTGLGLDGTDDSHFDNQIDTSNSMNGKPIYYIKGAVDAVYASSTNAATLYCIKCVNVTIRDMNGTGIFFWKTNHSWIQNNEAGIVLASSSNNTLSDNEGEIGLSFSSNNMLVNNTASIGLYTSSNNMLSGNNASNSSGIVLSSSRNNTLADNIASNNIEHGISLRESSDNILIGNNASNNVEDGIRLYLEANNNTLIRNIASNNTNGILLLLSVNNTLIGNTATNNKQGIRLSNSNNNLIYHNNFINNTVNAFDSTDYKNLWNATHLAGGNYWSDYNGTDANKDGIGDTPYNISGGAGAQDRYPFMKLITTPLKPKETSGFEVAIAAAAALSTIYIIRKRR